MPSEKISKAAAAAAIYEMRIMQERELISYKMLDLEEKIEHAVSETVKARLIEEWVKLRDRYDSKMNSITSYEHKSLIDQYVKEGNYKFTHIPTG